MSKPTVSVIAVFIAAALCIPLFAQLTEAKCPCNMYVVTGMKELSFETGTNDGGVVPVKKFKTVELPADGADTVMIALNGFVLAFGEIKTHGGSEDPYLLRSWTGTNHQFGFECVLADLVELTDTHAKISVAFLLSDKNMDDEWTGMAKVNILFLKCCPVPCCEFDIPQIKLKLRALESQLDSLTLTPVHKE